MDILYVKYRINTTEGLKLLVLCGHYICKIPYEYHSHYSCEYYMDIIYVKYHMKTIRALKLWILYEHYMCKIPYEYHMGAKAMDIVYYMDSIQIRYG